MAQVVANLLINAAGYTPPGGHIWLSAEQDDDAVTIRVRDDGEGIEPELLPRVFDLFVQGTRSFERTQGGLGLGLAIVKSLVTLHGGTVNVTSDREGSEFVVRVPIGRLPREETSDPTEDRLSPPRAVKRILVVDDNEDARELLGDVLRTFGHEVEVAHDGPTALGKLETFPADVAILDLGLPLMDGFELARRILECHREARPRLIALTGYDRAEHVAKGRAVGFDTHLVKPVNLPVLVAAIERPGATPPS
jgi:CheY-like chemotaxis protein